MLVLTRNIGEEIIIDGNIHVRVLEIRRNLVRLGFNAPDDVPIHRREVHERISEDDRHGVNGAF